MPVIRGLIVLACVVGISFGMTNENLIVSADATQCEERGEVLFCDYNDNKQDFVSMKPLETQETKKVFLYNARELYINDPVCINLVLHNVKNVLLNRTSVSGCNDTFKFTAKKSNMNGIPSSVDDIYLEECKVETLISTLDLNKLTLIDVEIGVMNVSGRLVNETTALLQNSKVNKLQKLVIDSGSKLVVQKTDIGSVEPGSLEVVNGSIVVSESSVKMVRLGAFEVVDFRGDATLKSVNDRNENESSLTDEILERACECSNFDTVSFYVCLALLFLSWGFIAYLLRDFLCKVFRSTSSSRNNNGRLREEFDVVTDRYSTSEALLKIETNKMAAKHSSPPEEPLDNQETEKIKEWFEKIEKVQKSFELMPIIYEEKETALENSEDKKTSSKDTKAGTQETPHQIGNYTDEDDDDHERELNENHKIIVKEISYLTNICEQEKAAFEIFKSMKMLKVNQTHSWVIDFVERAEHFSHNCKTKEELPGNEISRHEKELSRMFREIKKSMGQDRKSNKISRTVNMLRWNSEKQKAMDTYLDEVYNLQRTCQKQIKMVLDGNIEHAKKTFLLLIHMQIAYLKFLQGRTQT